MILLKKVAHIAKITSHETLDQDERHGIAHCFGEFT
jgi:hypothetical protein